MKLSERLSCASEFGDNHRQLLDHFERVSFEAIGDNNSQLLDHFERVSFEAHLNQVILLGRSLSEPSSSRPQQALTHGVAHSGSNRRGGRTASGLRRALKRLLRSVLGRKSRDSRSCDNNRSSKVEAELCVPMQTKCSYSKAFSRSVRI